MQLLPNRFLFRLGRKGCASDSVDFICCFSISNEQSPWHHKDNSSDKAGFLPGHPFSLLSSFCALHIQCIILPVIFPLQIWGNIQDSLPYLWILSYSFNPIHQGAHSLDHNFLLLWTQVLYTGKHPMGRISISSGFLPNNSLASASSISTSFAKISIDMAACPPSMRLTVLTLIPAFCKSLLS